MAEQPYKTPESRRTGVRIGDPLLPGTMDVLYLRPVLEALPPEWRTALDVGARWGDVTAELLAHGLRVLAVETDEFLVKHLCRRFTPERHDRRFQLERPPLFDDLALQRGFCSTSAPAPR